MSITAHVFGKEGCSKCAALKRRLERLLAKPEYSMIKMEYHDVLTLDGIVDFCKTGCLNPNRIPALLLADNGKYIEMPGCMWDEVEKGSGLMNSRFDPSVTYPYVGVQTNYDSTGVITESVVQDLLDIAKSLTEVLK
jgi:hypothetical protein